MTARALRLDLDLPPSVNAAFCNVAGRGRVKTARYRAWQRGALAAIQVQAGGVTFAWRFRLTVLASDQGLSRRRDADNLGKAVCDLLTKAGIIPDDSHKHMRAISIAWTPRLPAGRCAVTVIELATPFPAEVAPTARNSRCTERAGSHVSEVPGTPLPEKKNATPAPLQKRQNAPVKAKPAAVPASVMRELKRRGINVSPERVRL